jgi:hypothetical protein
MATERAGVGAGVELDVLVAERVMGLRRGTDFGTWPEHEWKLGMDGEIDPWAMESGNHNGPGCRRCWYSYCEHCAGLGTNDGPRGDLPCEVAPPPYSTSWEGMRLVVERMKADGWLAWIHDKPAGAVAMFAQPNFLGERSSRYHEAPTAPLAVCRAALAALKALESSQ